MKPSLKFVSYNGKYPNLCSGTLTIRLNGKRISMENALASGGKCRITADYEEHVTMGDWEVIEHKLPTSARPYITEITALVNEKVPRGCCGGCI
jgi:hypothetical protein